MLSRLSRFARPATAIWSRLFQKLEEKGLFTKELEDGLMAGTLDIAVHSMKDMPTALPSGLVIAAQLPREDVRDALLVRNGLLTTATSLVTLPYCAVVGTSSLRRQSQLLALRPDCRVVPFRGNVDSRIGKVKAGLVDATLLALAGLKRLGRANQASAVLDPSEMLPAVSQGAIAIQCRADASRLREILSLLHCRDTGDRTAAEAGAAQRIGGKLPYPDRGTRDAGASRRHHARLPRGAAGW